MTDYVLSDFVERRAELAGGADALQARLVQIGTDLDHLDAVIRPKRPRGPDAAGRGERGKLALDVLRAEQAPGRLVRWEVRS